VVAVERDSLGGTNRATLLAGLHRAHDFGHVGGAHGSLRARDEGRYDNNRPLTQPRRRDILATYIVIYDRAAKALRKERSKEINSKFGTGMSRSGGEARKRCQNKQAENGGR
jgi:hypothetical protein